MRKSIQRAFIALLAMISLSQGSVLFEDDFSGGKLEKWGQLGGQWQVRNKVLTVNSANESKLLVKDLELQDFEMQVEVKVSRKGQKAGFIFCAADSNGEPEVVKGSFAGIDVKNNLAEWESIDKERELVASKPGKILAGKWYKLRLQVSGNNARLYVNNMKEEIERFPMIDGVYNGLGKGMAGLAASGGIAEFRNFIIKDYSPANSGKTYMNPVQDGCADPVVKLFDGTYYLYCTYTLRSPGRVSGIRLFTSKDLVNWEDRGFAITNADSWGRRGFWAPDIVEKDGMYYLYYAAEERLCVATADTPFGPFKQKEQKPIEPDSIKIDGHAFRDDDGQYYLYYVHFADGNEIWGGKLNDDMMSVDEDSLRMMVRPDEPWEQDMGKVTEGPEIVKHKGTYYLTYSGSHFKSPEYAVGYATSKSPLGPWKKYEYNPIMKSTSYAHGTAHHTITRSPDGKEMFIVYHRHYSLDRVSPRKLSVDRIQFVPQRSGPDILEVWGPTSSEQEIPFRIN